MTPRKAELIAALGACVARLIVATLRFRVKDSAGVLGQRDPRLIWLFWHNRLFVVPFLLNHYLPERSGGALTSASKDGEVLAAFLRRFRIRPVRGSSSRRGAAALIEMIHVIRGGEDMAITPDGPRGPSYTLHPGVITLAQKSGAKIMPIRVRYARHWKLRSWDRFQIPKPFSHVEITLLPLEALALTEDEAAFEAQRARIELLLREGQE